ncbi:sensor histidine kinase [Brasilonema sp. UFV-L1]|uniref:sensor histidine kinase n=1 Tax=Brasilonema sp. UFV-L1 TaxID=2234130 RepID=UPI00403FC037
MSNESNDSGTTSNLIRGWRKFLGEARTRILLWYVLIITFIFVVSIPAFRLLLHARVDMRVNRELREKIKVFHSLVTYGITSDHTEKDALDIQQFEMLRTDERLQRPSSRQQLKDFFKAFLSSQLPDDDTFLIAFLDGKFYRSSPRGRPEQLAENSQLMQYWAKQTQPEQGEKHFSDSSVHSILYLTQPVKINGEILGVFVVAHTSAGEHAEALEAVIVIVQVSCVVLVVALVLAWVASGHVLAPLRMLIAAIRSTSESDLQKRISVQGQGEIAELATTFNEMMDRLQRAFTSQRNFINDAGHELQTPITIIRGHLELMDNDPEEIEETRILVLDELDRMSRFVEDMILLAKAERSDFLQLKTVDVAALTEELYAKAKILADRNWRLDAMGKGQIVVDRQRITQAVMNLVQNATQHTKNTDVISIGSTISNGKVHFWVRDTGEGIAVSDQQRIFERFARAAHSRRRSEGAGLGLSIVKAIAEAHCGMVKLRTQPGNGAKFTIVLPVEPPPMMNDQLIDNS